MHNPLSDELNNSLIDILLEPDFIILIQSNIWFSKLTRFLDTEPKEGGKTIGQASYKQKDTDQ